MELLAIFTPFTPDWTFWWLQRHNAVIQTSCSLSVEKLSVDSAPGIRQTLARTFQKDATL